MAKTRIKSAAADISVPQTRDDVSAAIARIGIAQRERERIQADMNDALAKLKEMHEAQAAPFKDEIEMLSKGVQLWCEAHRGELTHDGKRKFHHFAAGEVKWRMRPPSVGLRAMDNIIDACKRLGLARFVRVKEEVNKEAMLAEPDLAGTITGVTIRQGEDFVIVPFETELEEVA
ncbi:MAG: host-nuclease inhibitor Gam family protein [Methylotetracoccus sp.]